MGRLVKKITSARFPRSRIAWPWLGLCLLICSVSCAQQGVPIYGYVVHEVYPHDPRAFTQGLFFFEDHLYESTGQFGQSSIRKVEPESGKVLRQSMFPSDRFGEGIVDWNGQIFGLTWKSQAGYVWDLQTFALKRRFSYVGEGWGLTRNDDAIIMSNGTPVITFLDPANLQEQRRITVTLNGKPVRYINELEWYQGEILANLWQSNYIARIRPSDGEITGLIDLAGLLSPALVSGRKVDVLNGIATDGEGRLFVTGKYWPKLFLISPTDEPERYAQ